MKREFKLESLGINSPNATAVIIGSKPKDKPYVRISLVAKGGIDEIGALCVADKDLEKFAVNILKSIKSKKLKA